MNQDELTAPSVQAHLDDLLLPWRLEVVAETDSTNTRLKERARQGEAEGLVLVAGCQTAGRGRQGRKFVSPAGSGVYISLLLRPGQPMDLCTDFTAAAAVCTARAVERACGLRPDIKWVNDLMAGGKKLCGILTEGILDPDGAAVVVGIGVNVAPLQNAGPELAAIATSLQEASGKTVPRSLLAALILSEFDRWYADPAGSRPAMVEEYRRRMFLTGRQVTLSTDPQQQPHTVVGVDDQFHLLVRSPGGSLLTLQSGEVSVLPLTL